jgi:hypothetical protein
MDMYFCVFILWVESAGRLSGAPMSLLPFGTRAALRAQSDLVRGKLPPTNGHWATILTGIHRIITSSTKREDHVVILEFLSACETNSRQIKRSKQIGPLLSLL